MAVASGCRELLRNDPCNCLARLLPPDALVNKCDEDHVAEAVRVIDKGTIGTNNRSRKLMNAPSLQLATVGRFTAGDGMLVRPAGATTILVPETLGVL